MSAQKKIIKIILLLAATCDASFQVAFAHTLKIRLENNLNVRREDGNSLARETTLPRGTVIEITEAQMRVAQSKTYIRGGVVQAPLDFVTGFKILSAPGMSGSVVAELSNRSQENALFLAKTYVSRGTVLERRDDAQQVRLNEDALIIDSTDATTEMVVTLSTSNAAVAADDTQTEAIVAPQSGECTDCQEGVAVQAQQDAQEIADSTLPRNDLSWISPIEGGYCRIGDGFGWRIHPTTGQRQFHTALDLPRGGAASMAGTHVLAPFSGEITDMWSDATCGTYIKIRSDDGHYFLSCKTTGDDRITCRNSHVSPATTASSTTAAAATTAKRT